MADETMSDLTCRGEISDDDISFTGCLWIQRQERQVEEEERGKRNKGNKGKKGVEMEYQGFKCKFQPALR